VGSLSGSSSNVCSALFRSFTLSTYAEADTLPDRGRRNVPSGTLNGRTSVSNGAADINANSIADGATREVVP